MAEFDLVRALAERKAIVVHFSNWAITGNKREFPNDLQWVIENHAKIVLSCSVMVPGIEIMPVGSVGVMFEPQAAHVISVSNDDSGSGTDPEGNEYSGGVELTEEGFIRSLTPRQSYNEWRVKGAKVAGVFVHHPAEIYVKQKREIPTPPELEQMTDVAAGPATIDEVFAAFPEQKIYTLGGNGLELLRDRITV